MYCYQFHCRKESSISAVQQLLTMQLNTSPYNTDVLLINWVVLQKYITPGRPIFFCSLPMITVVTTKCVSCDTFHFCLSTLVAIHSTCAYQLSIFIKVNMLPANNNNRRQRTFLSLLLNLIMLIDCSSTSTSFMIIDVARDLNFAGCACVFV